MFREKKNICLNELKFIKTLEFSGTLFNLNHIKIIRIKIKHANDDGYSFIVSIEAVYDSSKSMLLSVCSFSNFFLSYTLSREEFNQVFFEYEKNLVIRDQVFSNRNQLLLCCVYNEVKAAMKALASYKIYVFGM